MGQEVLLLRDDDDGIPQHCRNVLECTVYCIMHDGLVDFNDWFLSIIV